MGIWNTIRYVSQHPSPLEIRTSNSSSTCQNLKPIFSMLRLRLVPHLSSGIVERAKRERAWKSPHTRKGDTPPECCWWYPVQYGDIVTASSLLPFFGTRLRRQNFNLAPTQYRQLRRLMAATTDGCRYSAYFYACGCSSTNKYSCATTNTVTGFKIFKKVLTKIWELDCVLQFSRNVFVTVLVNYSLTYYVSVSQATAFLVLLAF